MTRPTRMAWGQRPHDEEITALVDAFCDGRATDEERARLEALIQHSAEARDYFIAHTHLISELTLLAGVGDEPSLPRFASSPPAKRLVIIKWALAIAASGVFLAAATYWRGSRTASLSNDVIGVLHQVASNAPDRTQSDVSLSADTPLKLIQGDYEIRLKNGVVLAVAAPADILVQSPRQCRLDNGRMTATVPAGAEGFRVQTSVAEIVDHGTRFGVSVAPAGDTNIAVFEGNVDVHSGDEQRNLQMGRAVSIASNGTMSRMAVVQADSFAGTSQRVGPRGPTVLSVSDNIRSQYEMSYYHIIPEGFHEDQRAYVDRVHQWNGLDERGLPKELLGADCIMTFNDDKIVREIEITVTLAQEADLYVLLDERVKAPAWLINDFHQTELLVGMDEGARPRRMNDTRALGKGAGQSIDYRFFVWKRKTSSDGVVVLGSMPKTSGQVSMYGILALPVSARPNQNKAAI